MKFRLAAAHDAFLPCEHDHRHAAKQSIGCPCRQVQGAWTEGGDTDAGLAGETAIGSGHEGRTLLMTSQNELDRGGSQTLDDIQVFFARNPKDAVDTFVFEGSNK